MHDFSIDRIITINSINEMYSSVLEKAKYTGGSIRDFPQIELKGGNAVNIAYSLAKLGMKVNLFTIADEIGESILKQIFSKFGNEVNVKISEGKQGLTTILEFPNEKGDKVNVMLGDLGDINKFGPEKIDSKEHLDILANADVIVIVNWSSNLSGTKLIEYVFANYPNARRFLAPADLESRRDEFYNSIKKISEIIDILSINENEANSLAKSINLDILITEDNLNEENVKKVTKSIASDLKIKEVDLHTKIGSAWSDGKECIFSPSFPCEVNSITGAGDVWDSADIIGYLAKLQPKDRLLVSNAYASMYISNTSSEPVTMNELCQFLKRNYL